MPPMPAAPRRGCCGSSAALPARCCAAGSWWPDFGVAIYLISSNNNLMKSNRANAVLESQIAAVRGFSRFYTSKLGIIEPKLLDSPWTLQEARIIYEIARHPGLTATDLARALALDAGFLSRTLQTLQQREIVARKASKADRRASEIALTAKGRAAFAELDNRSRPQVAALLGKLDEGERAAVVDAMTVIEHALEPPAQKPAGYLLRSHRPGDIGWVVSRHGAVYAQEYGWGIGFGGVGVANGRAML